MIQKLTLIDNHACRSSEQFSGPVVSLSLYLCSSQIYAIILSLMTYLFTKKVESCVPLVILHIISDLVTLYW